LATSRGAGGGGRRLPASSYTLDVSARRAGQQAAALDLHLVSAGPRGPRARAVGVARRRRGGARARRLQRDPTRSECHTRVGSAAIWPRAPGGTLSAARRDVELRLRPASASRP
jgi:hypothetical protein